MASAVAGLFAFLARVRPIPLRLTVAAACVGALSQVLLLGWSAALAAVGIAGVVFALLFFTGVMGRSTTFALPAYLVFVPTEVWWMAVLGLLSVTVVGVFRVVSSGGLWGLGSVAIQTSNALQVGGLNGLQLAADANSGTSGTTSSFEVRRVNIYLHMAVAAFVAAGVYLGSHWQILFLRG